MSYNETELRKRAKQYFDSGVDEIYATSDGNFFYKESKSHAVAHSKQQKLQLFLLTAQGEVENPLPKETVKKEVDVVEEVHKVEKQKPGPKPK